MKINIALIEERLSRIYPLKLCGRVSEKLVFSCPEPYIDHSSHFHSGHVYMASAEHLPNRPTIENDVLLVCIGENSRLSYFKDRAAVMILGEDVNFFEAYHQLLQIFQIYTDWNRSGGNLDPQAFLSFLHDSDLHMEKKGAFLLQFDDIAVLCVNLFNAANEYIGCLILDYTGKTYVTGSDRLAEYLAHMIERTCEINPVLLQTKHTSLKELLQMIIRSVPLGKQQRLLLSSASDGQKYLCISIHYLKNFTLLPVSYICTVLESVFEGSSFFEHDHTILGVIPTSALSKESIQASLKNRLEPLADEMNLVVGISGECSALYLLKIYHQQAEAAIEHGQLYAPEERFHYFSEYALAELITNAFDSLPMESYYPAGFDELLSHDECGGISYLETLRVFLNENMSYTKAARVLFIHRSTLIERIERIERDLKLNLSDPDNRLMIQILLKAMHYEQLLKNK